MTIPDLSQLHPDLRCLCGNAGLDKEIKYIDIVEIPEGASWTSPGDFIITTGYFFRTDVDFEHLIRRLLQHQVAGMGIKLGKYVQKLPEVAHTLSEDYGFPIIAIPPELTYREIQQSQNAFGSPMLRNDLAVGDENNDMLQFFRETFLRNSAGQYQLEKLAQKAGISSSSVWLIAAVRADRAEAQKMITSATLQELAPFLLYDEPRGYLVGCFSPRADLTYRDGTAQYLQLLRRCCEDSAVGISESAVGPAAIHGAYQHAIFALRVGQAVAPGKTEYLFTDYLDYGLSAENRSCPVQRLLIDFYLRPLADHDARKSTQLLDTLLAADRCGYNMSLTCQALNIHRNTLYARMNNIQTLLPADLRKTEVQNQIHLALVAHTLSDLEL